MVRRGFYNRITSIYVDLKKYAMSYGTLNGKNFVYLYTQCKYRDKNA